MTGHRRRHVGTRVGLDDGGTHDVWVAHALGLQQAEKIGRRVKGNEMSIVDDLKAEAAKLLAEAEKVEANAKQDATNVDTDVKTAVAEVKNDAAAVETKVAAVVAVAKAPVVQFKGKKVMGVEYAADGLTIEWKPQAK